MCKMFHRVRHFTRTHYVLRNKTIDILFLKKVWIQGLTSYIDYKLTWKQLVEIVKSFWLKLFKTLSSWAHAICNLCSASVTFATKWRRNPCGSSVKTQCLLDCQEPVHLLTLRQLKERFTLGMCGNGTKVKMKASSSEEKTEVMWDWFVL